MTTEEWNQVDAAVKRVRALRKTARESQMSTTRSQSLVLRALPDQLLVIASEILETGQDQTDGTHTKK
jgi:hypothetical protein